MKAKAIAVILIALTSCWPAAGFSEAPLVNDPLIGSWKCEISRPDSRVERPLFITVFPGGLGFIVSGSDVSGRLVSFSKVVMITSFIGLIGVNPKGI